MGLLGILAWLCYRLSRFRFVGLPLDVATGLLAGGAAAYAPVGAFLTAHWPGHPALAVALAAWAATVLAMRRLGFLLFRAEADTPAGPALTPFERVPLRASGQFEVGEQHSYYVEAEGTIEATALGERIVMVQVRPRSLLGLAHTRPEEWGWWYIFFRREELRKVTAGQLQFGWRPRPTLRLRNALGRPLAYLSFDDRRTRDRVAADLQSFGLPS